MEEFIQNEDIKILQNEIVNGLNKKWFTNSSEASTGKTYGSRLAIESYLKEKYPFAERKFIFVTKFKDQAVDFVKNINESLGKNIAIAYLSQSEFADKNQEYVEYDFEKACEKDVLLITHAMYINICLGKTTYKSDKEYRKIIEEKRFHTLIIDEQIDNVKDSFFEFNLKKYEEINKVLSVNDLYTLTFEVVCKPWTSLILEKQTSIKEGKIDTKHVNQLKYINDFFLSEEFKEILSERLDYLKSIKLDEQYIKDLKRNRQSYVDNTIIQEFIKGVELLYKEVEKNNVLINRNGIYTYNSNFEFFKLKNNIWLDASSKFHYLYKISKDFKVQDTQRIIDHSKSNLYIFWENTSTSNKNAELTKFRKEKIDFINKHTEEGSKILIVSNKSETQALQEEFINESMREKFEIDTTNYESMRGRNDWKDYNYIYTIQTPRMPFAYYVFLYEYYSKEKLNDLDIYCSNKGNKEYAFENAKLHVLMETEMASVLYQTLKRIQRNANPKAEIYVFCNLKIVNKLVTKQLYNINIIEEGKKEFLKDKFETIIQDIKCGNYRDYKIVDKKTNKKTKAVKSVKGRYLCVNKKMFYDLLDIDNTSFNHNIKNKIISKDLGIKFETQTIRVYP